MPDLQLLFDNQIPCITIDNFLSPTQISNFLSALKNEPEWKPANIEEVHAHLFDNDAPLPRQLFSSQYRVISNGVNEIEYLEKDDRRK